MTKQELAQALGISSSMVSRLSKRGMPVDSVDRAKRWRRRHLEPGRTKGVRFDPAAADQTGADAPAAVTASAPEAQAEYQAAFNEYSDARATKERYLALAAQRDYLISEGKLIDAEWVNGVATLYGSAVRQGMEQLPFTAALKIEAVSSASEATIKAILLDEIRAVMDAAEVHLRPLIAAARATETATPPGE